MGQPLNPRVIKAGPLIATAPRTGNLNDNSALRVNNMLLRGFREGYRFWEEFAGLEDINEDVGMVPLTGTLALDATTDVIIGTGTAFNTEVHLGQFICVIPGDNSASQLLVVKTITDNTHFTVWKRPTVTVSGWIGWQMPIVFSVNEMRGTALRGNVLKLDRGSFLGVGSGTFRLNGQPLAGMSMSLSRRPTIALYDATASTYTVFELGMDTPTPPVLAAIGGGTKMQGGSYSFVITPARKETVGYNNPSDRADVTIATNDLIACTFPPMDTAHGQNAWIVWVTTFSDTLSADVNYLNGPWHRLRLVDDTEVSSAGGTVNFEYYDAEVENNELVSFNNDAPTDAEFVELLNAVPVWLSCQGQGNVTHPEATSPGPFIVPAKPRNIEAAPLSLAFSSSPPETILGAVMAQGRIYLLTVNRLQIAQSTPSDAVPILIRPFWHDGFANPYQLIFVNGTLYGYPVAGPSRSVGDGDEIESERNWASDVWELIAEWNAGQVLVGFDPENDAVWYIHAADRLNDAGYWTSKWIAYGISANDWIGAGEFTEDNKDQIVSGAATVGENLVLMISGRQP